MNTFLAFVGAVAIAFAVLLVVAFHLGWAHFEWED